jgi:hypothetical protein
MEDIDGQPREGNDKGPTEKLRDEEKAGEGKSVTEESAVPGAQDPQKEEIKYEKSPNTE